MNEEDLKTVQSFVNAEVNRALDEISQEGYDFWKKGGDSKEAFDIFMDKISELRKNYE